MEKMTQALYHVDELAFKEFEKMSKIKVMRE